MPERQTDLFGGDVDTRATELRPPYRAVLEAIEAGAQLESDDAGAIVHELRGVHHRDTRCQWCGRDGKQAMTRLRELGLVEARKTSAGGGYTRRYQETADAVFNEFPPGF